jgi:hypothetical protein
MDQSENISLRHALLDEAQILAREEGLPVEEIVNVALEQGLIGLRSAHFFRSRRGNGDLNQAFEILRRTGKGNSPLPDDEIPADLR